jgi:2-hydroxy-3-keto-5-methylthiopentenyl-1-phosphate phosphatase
MYDTFPPLGSSAVFFDFDNTVTTFDVLGDFIRRFAVDGAWEDAEDRWRRGRIGSRQCLEEQARCLRVTRRRAEKYLDGITADPAFAKIVALLRQRGSEPVIVSDSFYFFIDRILKNSGITGLTIFSSQARFHKDRVIPFFLDKGRSCFACANCKKRYLQLPARQQQPIIYVGDGLSDLCASRLATSVYAKDELARRLKKERSAFLPFRTLSDIYNEWKEIPV